MKTINFEEFSMLKIIKHVEVFFDKSDDALISIRRLNGLASDWIAVPMREEIYDNECTDLAKYSIKTKVKYIYGFSGLYAQQNNEVLEGNATVKNFATIESKHALRTYIILPDSGGFQVASDGDYYTVFIGPKEFISSVLNLSIDETIQRFTKFMELYKNREESVYRCLSKVLKACNEFNLKR